MESNIEEIRDYLGQLCSTATFTVDEIKPKRHYKSYKIGIPIYYFETIFSADIWPENAKIKLWFPSGQFHKSKKKGSTQIQLTFCTSCGNQE